MSHPPLPLGYRTSPCRSVAGKIFPLHFPFSLVSYSPVIAYLFIIASAQMYKNPCACLAEQQAIVAQDSPLFLMCVLGYRAPFPSFLLVETQLLGHVIAIRCPSPVNSMARSQILGNAAWLFVHVVFLPLLLELTRRPDVCHTARMVKLAH